MPLLLRPSPASSCAPSSGLLVVVAVWASGCADLLDGSTLTTSGIVKVVKSCASPLRVADTIILFRIGTANNGYEHNHLGEKHDNAASMLKRLTNGPTPNKAFGVPAITVSLVAVRRRTIGKRELAIPRFRCLLNVSAA